MTSSTLSWFALTTACVVFILSVLHGSRSPGSPGEVGGPADDYDDSSHQTMMTSNDEDQIRRRRNEDALRWRHQVNDIEVTDRPTSAYSFSDLGGPLTWRIVNSNGSIDIAGSVPGTVHTALQKAGLIDDPYYRFNDDVYRWISYDSWSYYSNFTVSAEEASRQVARLVCDGLDTIATIYINDVIVGTANNQFVGYVFDVTNAIQEGFNSIRVDFRSAVSYTNDSFHSHPYVVPPICPPAEYHPECHANFIRKAQCSFSWDWGPAFPTQGIWNRIGLETFNGAVIRSITPYPFRDADGWKLNITVFFDAVDVVTGQIFIDIAELRSSSTSIITIGNGRTQFSDIVSARTAQPWWPRGYGNAKLYTVKVTFTAIDRPSETSSVSLKTGFRTVELVQDTMDNGLTFYFKINDVPVFMKGSNWIPADSFLDKLTYGRLRRLLLSAADANMNSIRIWGGGVYESDDFYDIADELGILVWQDLMFACSMYPTNTDYLQNVNDETVYQMKRLSHHPSIVAWTANNENEGALVDNWYGTAGANYNMYKQDYVRLYIETIRPAILNIDPTRAFLSSSPTNGLITEDSGWISESPRPSDPRFGDVHYYNYYGDCLDYTQYPLTRYASEYGFQSWPAYSTLLKVASEADDLYYGSTFWRHREHHLEAGNGTENVVRRHFKWPNSGDILKDFKMYIYLTQVAQAVCYQAETEFYRRSRSNPEARTMGALYWQHNDIWQAPSWSTIDYDSNWKMAHYFAARFFADPIVSIIKEQSNISIYTVTDKLTSINQVQLFVELWSWSNIQAALHQWTDTVDVVAEGSFKVFEKPVDDILNEGGCSAPAQCFLTTYIDNGSGQRLTEINAYYFVSWKDAQGFQDPKIQVIDVREIDGSTFTLTLRSSAISAFTWLEAVGVSGRFSDNGFLITSSEVTLTFYAWQSTTVDELLSAVTVTTLYETLI